MITPMKKYTFLVFHKEYDAFLEQLREAGVVHISQKAEGVADDPKLQELIQKQKELQHIMDQGAPDQLVQERADVLKHIAETEKEAEAASVWGSFSMENAWLITCALSTTESFIKTCTISPSNC